VITKEECLRLISQLWADDFPLVKKYFGKYIGQLVEALLDENPYEGRFAKAAFEPQALERRLQRIEETGQTSRIVSEVGELQDPIELDRRLMDAWAELRTICQLCKEGFGNISKVTEIADLTATRGDEKFAFQVKRINNSLDNQVNRMNEPGKRDSDPTGEIGEIYSRLGEPLSYFFWDSLEKKNGKFKDWVETYSKRCIVIVSGDEDLQDPMVRHIACQKIREGLHSLINRHFDELLWLPDLSNGAWFKVKLRLEDTQCFADWADTFGNSEMDTVNRREIDLNSVIPAQKQFFKSGGG